MNRPIPALTQSYTRTKAADLAAFRRVMNLHSNSSNNTLFADTKGNIAYFHSNYIPRRDTSLDWTVPVDGSDPRTDYRGLLSFDESPNAVNPASGWAYNSNNWPWSAAGSSSPRREAFPRYVETGFEETPRGLHALRELEGSGDWTPVSLTAAAFDTRLPAFERLLPPLIAAYDQAAAKDSRKRRLADEIAVLRAWDRRWAATSIPTTLAIYWAERAVRAASPAATAARLSAQTYVATRAGADTLLDALVAASDTLTQVFGTWKTPWGEVNRFQRIDEHIEPRFDDAQPSRAVPFTSGIWGSLAAFGAKPYPGTKKWYGSSGNSFLAAVEFGDTLRAIAVTAGGASGHRDSPHFDDQAERYIQGNLREVYFHPWQLVKHTARVYHPGE
jgi:acyl-homoserine-lactone acylase